MSADGQRGHGTAIAVALDTEGKAALAYLTMQHEGVLEHLACFSCIADVAAEPTPRWQRLLPSLCWEPTSWDRPGLSLAAGLYTVVGDVLGDLERSTRVDIDWTTLAILLPRQMIASPDDAQALGGALHHVREQLFVLKRVFLIIYGPLSCAPSAPPGTLDWLPWQDAAAPGVFEAIDYVVLMGEATPEGSPASQPAACAIATALWHLTAGPLSLEIQRHLTSRGAGSPITKRFLALGATKLRVGVEDIPAMLALPLQRQLGQELLEQYDQEQTAQSVNVVPEAALEQAVRDVTLTFDTARPTPGIQRGKDYAIMHEHLLAADWDIHLLKRMNDYRQTLLAQAVHQALQEEIVHEGAAAQLATDKRLGKWPPPPPPPLPQPPPLPNIPRILLIGLGLLLLLAAGSVYGLDVSLAAFSPLQGSLGCVIGALLSMVLAFAWPDPPPTFRPPHSPPQLEDLEKTQQQRRHKRQALVDWLAQCQREQHQLTKNMQALRTLVQQPVHAVFSPDSVTLPEVLYTQLLLRHGTHGAVVLRRFKQACTDPLAVLLGDDALLVPHVQRFVHEYCQSLDITALTTDLWATLCPPVEPLSPWLYDVGLKLYTASLPRVPTWGEDTWHIITLPAHDLTIKATSELFQRFYGQRFLTESGENVVYCIQITCGFTCSPSLINRDEHPPELLL